MLHEILISLSGVPSPIWQQYESKSNSADEAAINTYVSESEQAMLQQLSHLAEMHAQLIQDTKTISASHPSLICRAVSSSISNTTLAAFRRKIRDVEASILQNDAGWVGGYQIVPLGTLVTEFAVWTRPLKWLRQTTDVMLKGRTGSSRSGCTGAQILDLLETEIYTGYADIHDIAVSLLEHAQKAWMRAISSWVLYGQPPSFGTLDFCIQREPSINSVKRYRLERDLLPAFVTLECAENILAIGVALNTIRKPTSAEQGSLASIALCNHLLPEHLEKLKRLTYPLNSSFMESVMSSINSSVSRNVLSHLVPLNKVLELTKMMHHYMLLGRGEFAVTLLNNIEERIKLRQKSHAETQPVRKLGRLDDLVLKESELSSVLNKCWSDLSLLQSELESDDTVYLAAKEHLRFVPAGQLHKNADSLVATVLPSLAALNILLAIDSPLVIFLQRSSVVRYSEINIFLLSMRRAGLRLTDLWKMSGHRRCYPSPPLNLNAYTKQALARRRAREDRRRLATRGCWLAASKALFVLNEIEGYLHGEVISNSYRHLESWLTGAANSRKKAVDSASSSRPSTASAALIDTPSNTYTPHSAQILNSQQRQEQHQQQQQQNPPTDPRAMADAHDSYLKHLYEGILLNSTALRDILRKLFNLIDHFHALFARVQTVWQGLDLQEDDGVLDAFTNHAQDEKDVLAEMQSARVEIDDYLQKLVQCIKEIEGERNLHDLTSGIATVAISTDAQGGFVPWRAKTLDRLIMKLDMMQGQKEDEPNENEIMDDI